MSLPNVTRADGTVGRPILFREELRPWRMAERFRLLPRTSASVGRKYLRMRRLYPLLGAGKNWLPFVGTYRTLCLAPEPDLERALTEIRSMTTAA